MKKKRKFKSVEEIFKTYIPEYIPQSQEYLQAQVITGSNLATTLLNDFRDNIKNSLSKESSKKKE